jgi:chromosome segregation ATPase
MTLKETITQELLEGVHDPEELKQVFQRHKSSKGPFYLGLAEATQQLERQLCDLARDQRETRGRRKDLRQELAALAAQRAELAAELELTQQQLAQRESHLAQIQGTLEKVALLEQQGFGEEELKQLYQLLRQAAASQEAPEEDAVALFFQIAQSLGQITSLELEIAQEEAKAAQAREAAQGWAAEAQRVQAETEALKSLIDVTAGLLEQGVTPEDLLGWGQVLENAGERVEDLRAGIAEYGSLA